MTMDDKHQVRSCPDDETLHRYALGRLPDQQAEAVEEHYFGCDRCWSEIERTVEVRASFDDTAAAGRSTTPRRLLQGLAMAAVIAIAALGLWLWTPPAGDGEILRGGEGGFELSVGSSEGTWTVEWAAVPGAASYLLEVTTRDGQSLLSLETVQPKADLTLPEGTRGVTYWKVQALDTMRQTVERSTPIEVSVDP